MGKGNGSGAGWGDGEGTGGLGEGSEHGEWKHGLCSSCSPAGTCKLKYKISTWYSKTYITTTLKAKNL